jgi:hypothetical protein
VPSGRCGASCARTASLHARMHVIIQIHDRHRHSAQKCTRLSSIRSVDSVPGAATHLSSSGRIESAFRISEKSIWACGKPQRSCRGFPLGAGLDQHLPAARSGLPSQPGQLQRTTMVSTVPAHTVNCPKYLRASVRCPCAGCAAHHLLADWAAPLIAQADKQLCAPVTTHRRSKLQTPSTQDESQRCCCRLQRN